jgi:hypothetical protein
MPFNGSGTFTIVAGNPVVTGTVISSTVQNNTTNDFATGFTNCVTRDGQSAALSNLPMGGYKHTGAGAASSTGEYLLYGQASANLSSLTVGTFTTTGNANINGNVTVGDALADTLTINPNAVNWAAGSVAHTGSHDFAGNLSNQGNATLGSSDADTVTVNGTASFPLAPSTHSFGLLVGNAARAGLTTFDWYEEDPGTTELTVFGTGTAGSATYSSRTLRWQRDGNTVCFRGLVSWSGHTGTGSIGISGLPFAPADVCAITVVAENLTFSGQLVALINTLSPQIGVYSMTTGAALVGVAIDATAAIYISGSYRV